MEIWRFDVIRVDQASIWINHGENKLEDSNSYCRLFTIDLMYMVFVVSFNLLKKFSTG